MVNKVSHLHKKRNYFGKSSASDSLSIVLMAAHIAILPPLQTIFSAQNSPSNPSFANTKTKMRPENATDSHKTSYVTSAISHSTLDKIVLGLGLWIRAIRKYFLTGCKCIPICVIIILSELIRLPHKVDNVHIKSRYNEVSRISQFAVSRVLFLWVSTDVWICSYGKVNKWKFPHKTFFVNFSFLLVFSLKPQAIHRRIKATERTSWKAEQRCLLKVHQSFLSPRCGQRKIAHIDLFDVEMSNGNKSVYTSFNLTLFRAHNPFTVKLMNDRYEPQLNANKQENCSPAFSEFTSTPHSTQFVSGFTTRCP